MPKTNVSKRLRNFCFTQNNFTDAHKDAFRALSYSFLAWAEEMGESGTPHLQGYCELKNQMGFKKLKQLIPGAHIEPRKGTAQQALDYFMDNCEKGPPVNPISLGVMSKPGTRTDLVAVRDSILAGKTVDALCLEDPMLIHQYGRTLDRIEDIAARQKFRTEMTTCDWLYGPTGVGKSHSAFEGFTPDTHYVWKYDGEWQDGYRGQDTVIINEFRGQIPFGILLQLIDKWPMTVRRRGREPIPFVSKHIIITSALHPRDIFKKLEESDRMDQLYRRVKLIEMSEKVTPFSAQRCPGGNTTTPEHLFNGLALL